MNIDNAHRRALDLYKDKNYLAIEQLYEKLIEQDNCDALVYHNLGKIKLKLNKNLEAMQLIRRALEYSEASSALLQSAKKILRQLEAAETSPVETFKELEALEKVNKLVAGAKIDHAHQLLIKYVTSYPECKSLRDAKDKLERANSFRDSLVRAFNAGSYQILLNEVSRAPAVYQNNLKVKTVCASALMELGQLEEATKLFEAILESDPNILEARHNFATLLRRQHNFLAAISEFKKALIVKRTRETYEQMLQLFIMVDTTSGLEESFTDYINEGYGDAEVVHRVVSGLIHKGNEQMAEKLLVYAQDHDVCNIKTLELTSSLLIKSKKYLEASQVVGNLVSLDSKNLIGLNHQGVIEASKNNFEGALDIFRQCLSIDGQNELTLTNLAINYLRIGEHYQALEHYIRLLKINPSSDIAWTGVSFCYPSQSMDDRSAKLLLGLSAEHENNTLMQVKVATIFHNLGGDNFLTDAYDSILRKNEVPIRSEKRKSAKKNKTQFQRKVILLHYGRSGTGLLHSLIDNHPSITTSPGILFSQFYDQSVWEKINTGNECDPVKNFINTYPVYFDAASEKGIPQLIEPQYTGLGVSEGLTNLGKSQNEKWKLDEEQFLRKLTEKLLCYNSVTRDLFFELVHATQDELLERQRGDLLFYHIHNPSRSALNSFLHHNPNALIVFSIRHPIQSLESWIRPSAKLNDYTRVAGKIAEVLQVLRNSDLADKSYVIKLEDIKNKPRSTLSRLCKILDIEYKSTFEQMTVSGRKWWGDPSSPHYKLEGMRPFGKRAINSELGEFFSTSDLRILRVLFQPFLKIYGYESIEQSEYKKQLKDIENLVSKPFDLEIKVAEAAGLTREQLLSHGQFKILRNIVSRSYNELKEYGTYQNMISNVI